MYDTRHHAYNKSVCVSGNTIRTSYFKTKNKMAAPMMSQILSSVIFSFKPSKIMSVTKEFCWMYLSQFYKVL